MLRPYQPTLVSDDAFLIHAIKSANNAHKRMSFALKGSIGAAAAAAAAAMAAAAAAATSAAVLLQDAVVGHVLVWLCGRDTMIKC